MAEDAPRPGGPPADGPDAPAGEHGAPEPLDSPAGPIAAPAPPPPPPVAAPQPPAEQKEAEEDSGPPAATPLPNAAGWIRGLSWVVVGTFLVVGLIFLVWGLWQRGPQDTYVGQQRTAAVKHAVITADQVNNVSSSELEDLLTEKRREIGALNKPSEVDQVALNELEALDEHRPSILPGRGFAIAFGFLSVGLMLLVVQGLRSTDIDGNYGVFRPLIGADKRFSTSNTQMWLWTLAAVTAFGFLLGRTIFEEQDLGRVLPEARWDDYLILLGGPFAAAVLAKGTIQWKMDKGQLQKTDGTPAPSQVFRGDDGAADLVDTQYLMFNGIALGYFAVQILANPVLPEIPGPLLAMTSGTAALYVGNKAAQRNAPTITSIDPKTATPGESVKLTGSNFAPGEQDDDTRRVSVVVEGVTSAVHVLPDWNDTCVEFVVPLDASVGPKRVSLISSASVQTEAVGLEVATRKPVVAGVLGPVRPRSEVTVVGLNLRPQQGNLVWVSFGTRTAVAPVGDGTSLTVTVPSDLEGDAKGEVEVRARTGSGVDSTSDPITVKVEGPKIWGVDVTGTTVRARGTGFGEDAGEVQLLVDGVTLAASYAKVGSADVVTGTLATAPNPGTTLHVRVIDDLGRHADLDVTV